MKGLKSHMKCLKLIIACCTLVVCACGDATLKRGYGETPEELGRAVVSALNAKSAENLFHLRVDKDQYIDELWPEFPSKHNSFTAEFAWNNLNKRNMKGIPKWVQNYGGKNYDFVRIRFTRPTRDYKTFKLRGGTVLTVKTPEGKERDLHILGSVVEKERYYRLLSYDD